MLKKNIIAFILFLFVNSAASAQSLQISLDYHSFDPFIHFQLRFDNHQYPRPYRMAYLKGYMDGVNDRYRYEHRYRAMVRVERAYETGYRDGFRDRGLLIQIRGKKWLHRYKFGYRDYYSPSYAVRIWLDNITLAFLKAPARRLPPGWQRKVHPRVRRYRGWMKWRRHPRDYEDFDDYYEEYYKEYEEDDYREDYGEYEEDDDDYERFGNIQRRYRKQIKHLKRRALQARKKNQPRRPSSQRRHSPNVLRRIDDRKAFKHKKNRQRRNKKRKHHKRGRGRGRDGR